MRFKFFSPPNIVKLKNRKDVEGLIKALEYSKNEHFPIREAAVVALGDLGDTKAIQPIYKAVIKGYLLKQPLEKVAVTALGKIGDIQAIDSIFNSLTIKTGERYEQIVYEAIKNIENVSGKEALVNSLLDRLYELTKNNPDRYLRNIRYGDLFFYILGRIGGERIAEALSALLVYNAPSDLKRALRNIGVTAIKPLCNIYYHHKDGMAIRQAAEILVELDWLPDVEEEKVKYLILTNNWQKIVALGKSVEEYLLRKLSDDFNSYDKLNFIYTLGEIGSIRSTELLLDIYMNKDNSHTDRISAVKALIKINETKSVNKLIDHFINSRENDCDIAKAILTYCSTLDRIFIDKILSCLFDYPRGIGTFSEISFSNLFGDYQNMIIDACSYQSEGSDYDGKGGHYFMKYSLTKSDDAIKKLCSIQSRLSNNILYLIAQKSDIAVVIEESVFMNSRYEILSFASQRAFAREELDRRGNTMYDPSVYLCRDNWII